jgi:hypothetical protein
MNTVVSNRRVRYIAVGVGSAVLLGGLAVAASAARSEGKNVVVVPDAYTAHETVVTGGKVDYEPATGWVTREPMTTVTRTVDTRSGEMLDESTGYFEVRDAPAK